MHGMRIRYLPITGLAVSLAVACGSGANSDDAMPCPVGTADCDGDTANGCESLTTADNCGACGNICGTANTTNSECVSGSCVLACEAGFGLCDGDDASGCESSLDAPTSCGSCENVCSDSGSCVDSQQCICDVDIELDTNDPRQAAYAMGICDDLVSAAWSQPDGTAPPKNPNFALGHGVLSAFGPNVVPREGVAMLALSSGTARAPSDAGYQSPEGFSKGYTSNAPEGFPKESPACPGVVTGMPSDAAGLKVILDVPEGVTGLALQFNFYTYEWPQFICSTYNDFFVVMMSPTPEGQIDGNIVFDMQGNPVSVNSSFIEVCACPNGPPCNAGGHSFACAKGNTELEGTGFGADTEDAGHGATSWIEMQAVIPEATDQIELVFAIYDSGDSVLDSTVLLDGFHWIVE